MDPDEALARAREASQRYVSVTTPDARELAARDLVEAFDALDQWVSRGGFLPAAWGADR